MSSGEVSWLTPLHRACLDQESVGQLTNNDVTRALWGHDNNKKEKKTAVNGVWPHARRDGRGHMQEEVGVVTQRERRLRKMWVWPHAGRGGCGHRGHTREGRLRKRWVWPHTGRGGCGHTEDIPGREGLGRGRCVSSAHCMQSSRGPQSGTLACPPCL